jgi:hypothetical protein
MFELSRIAQRKRVCKPNSVLRRIFGAAIIPLAHLSPDGSSDLPGDVESPKALARTGRPLTPPYLVLHREEFA